MLTSYGRLHVVYYHMDVTRLLVLCDKIFYRSPDGGVSTFVWKAGCWGSNPSEGGMSTQPNGYLTLPFREIKRGSGVVFALSEASLLVNTPETGPTRRLSLVLSIRKKQAAGGGDKLRPSCWRRRPCSDTKVSLLGYREFIKVINQC